METSVPSISSPPGPTTPSPGPATTSPDQTTPPSRDHLTRLPNEVILMVADQLPTRSDFLSLMRTSPDFYGVLSSNLYSRSAASSEERGVVAWAAERGFVETIRRTINAGWDFTSPRILNFPTVVYPVYQPADWEGSHNALARSQLTTATPLHLAIIYRRPNAAALLLDSGANLSTASTNLCFHEADDSLRMRYQAFPHTAIDLAISTGQTNMVQMLKKHGAKGPKHQRQPTPAGPMQSRLHTAAARGDTSLVLEVFTDLIGQHSWTNADPEDIVNDPDANGNTPLHYLVHFRLASTSPGTIQATTTAPADTLTGTEEPTPSLGRPNHTISLPATITLLISLGADIDAVNNAGHTPLLRACMAGNLEVAAALVLSGRANPNIGTIGRGVGVPSWRPRDWVNSLYARGHRLNVRYWNGRGAEEDWMEPLPRHQGRAALGEVDRVMGLLDSGAAGEFM